MHTWSFMMRWLLYLKPNASEIGIGVILLQTRDCMRKFNKCRKRYSNIDRETLGILHRIEKFHHYYFAREVGIITDQKLFVVIFEKVVVTLFNWFSIHTTSTPIHSENTIWTWTKSLQSRLPVTTEPQRRPW